MHFTAGRMPQSGSWVGVEIGVSDPTGINVSGVLVGVKEKVGVLVGVEVLSAIVDVPTVPGGVFAGVPEHT